MTRALTSSLIASVSSLLIFCASPVLGQQRKLPIERILNPLPDFDPFEKPPTTPRFFPDQADKRARELLVDALTNRHEALKDHWKYFEQEDARLEKEYGTVTGLSDHARDLVNNDIQDREQFLAAQRQALKDSSTPERKKYLESIINHDDLNQSEFLMRRGATNFWGAMLNRMLGSVDLVGVASGNYVGAAVETAVSQMFAFAENEMPIEERRALARDLDHLKRYPDDPHNEEIIKRVKKLNAKKQKLLIKKQLDKSRETAAKGDLDKALFYARIAAFLGPESAAAEKLLQETQQQVSRRDGSKSGGLRAAVEQNQSVEEQNDVRDLLEALSLRDAHQVERLAVDIDKKHHGKPLADAARDAEAVAIEMKGWHDAAKKAVAEIARSSNNPDAKRRAETLLQSREYNLLATFQDARSERQLESVKYVLLGEDLLKKNLLYAAGALAVTGPSAGATLGIVNAMMMGTNLYKVLTNNPVSAQPVIDAGVSFVRSHPNSDNAKEVYEVLAEAYEDRGLFDKAITFYELSGTASKEKIAEIKEKAANALLNAAVRNRDRSAQQAYLTALLDAFPESSAAQDATRKLSDMVKTENNGLRMTKQFLMENPELYGPSGLGLKPALFDGNTANMELADRGVSLIGDNEILLHYQTPWGVQSKNYTLTSSRRDRFFVQLRDTNHQVAMADIHRRAKGTVGGINPLPLEIVRGERERQREETEARGDTTFTLIREAEGPTAVYPEVLNYELLSENERDPGSKYKLPPMQGSISASRFTLSGALPTGLWGNQIAVGSDNRSAFAGVRLPMIPLLEDFIPVDFMVQGRPGGFSVYPKIHMGLDAGEDPELYR